MIYKTHLKRYLFLSLIYLLIIISTTTIFLSLYNNYLLNKNNLISIYNNISPLSLNILKISYLSFDNILYYYVIYLNVGIFFYLLLASHLAIKTINEDNKYINIFITKPFSKGAYLKKKISLAIFSLFIVNLIIYIYLIIYFSFYNLKQLYLVLFLIQLALFLTSITTYSITLAITSFIKNKNFSILLALGLLALFLIISIIYKTTNFSLLSYICPLCYFDYISILDNTNLSLNYLASIIIFTVFGLNLAICEYGSEKYV